MEKVLVVIVYTEHKAYCNFLYPRIYQNLSYPNKELAYITEKNYPELGRKITGEERAAYGRQMGIEKAKKINADWIFFLDYDTEPDTDIIEKMLKINHPIVGGLHCARGNAWHCIGHNYTDRKSLNRIWLRKTDLKDAAEVDGISGGTLLLQKGIFWAVDYNGYLGPETIPGRFTADDEYLQIKIYNRFKIKPKVAINCTSWHYHEDGRAYKLWGQIKQWRAY